MPRILQLECRNILLRNLSPSDFASLRDTLERFDAGHRDCLHRPGEKAEFVYFPETGFASVTAQSDPVRTEVGLIGREGFVGIPVLLCDGVSLTTTSVQMAGTFIRTPAATFKTAVLASPLMLDLFLRYVQAYLIQLSSTALANGAFNIEARLARWLLMAADRMDSAEIALTHETLSMMLGVRRPGVTVATHVLEGDHAIRATRGKIEVLNRAKLLNRAGASYGGAEAEYDRLIGRTVGDAVSELPHELLRSPEWRVSGTIDDTELQGHSVLVVEDDYHVAQDAERTLIEAGGLVLGPVAREDRALAVVARRVLGCALVDINLGQGARFNVADALQERGVPFAFVTGYDDDVIPARFDAVERLRKPADPRLLVQVAARLCAGGRRSPQTLVLS